MKLRYVGAYSGTVLLTGSNVKPGEVFEVSDAQAEELLKSAQFEKVKETPTKGGE